MLAKFLLTLFPVQNSRARNLLVDAHGVDAVPRVSAQANLDGTRDVTCTSQVLSTKACNRSSHLTGSFCRTLEKFRKCRLPFSANLPRRASRSLSEVHRFIIVADEWCGASVAPGVGCERSVKIK